MSRPDPAKELQAAIMGLVSSRVAVRLQEHLAKGDGTAPPADIVNLACRDSAALLRGIADQLEAKR